MCYSKPYKYSDGEITMYNTGLAAQLVACESSSKMRGGKRYKSRIKRKSRIKSRFKSRHIKSRRLKKRI